MPRTIGSLRVLSVTLLVFYVAGCASPGPLTVPERSNYARTSTSNDVESFVDACVARSTTLRRLELGKTVEGRSLVGVLRAVPPVASLAEARARPEPKIVVMANIHAGEVEGKEAVLEMLRREAFEGGLSAADGCVVLFIPNYNADGNDRMSRRERPDQAGPVEGVGRRRNARDRDLNRDYMRVREPETRALLGAVAAMDADVVMDLHTTNGSFHGFDLTYAGPLNPATAPHILGVTRGRLLPEARAAMARRGYSTFDYGNWRDASDPAKGWETFEPHPRFGTSYFGLCNRFTILSEAYSHEPFERRIAATRAFVEECLSWIARNAEETLEARRTATRFSAGLGGMELPTGATYARTHEAEPIPVGRVTEIPDPVTGLVRQWDTGETTLVPMPVWAWFEGREGRTVPDAWLVVADMDAAAAVLDVHGIPYTRRTESGTVEAEVAVVTGRRPGSFADMGRVDAFSVRRGRETVAVPEGALEIASGTPLARLAFHLLEPETDDNLGAWGHVRPIPTTGPDGTQRLMFPILRIVKPDGRR